MSASPITSVIPTPSYNTATMPLNRDGVAIAVIDSALDNKKIPPSRILSGTVRDVAHDGTVHIDTDAGPLTARLPDRVTATPGQSVRIELAQNANTTPVPHLATLSENTSSPGTQQTQVPSPPSSTTPQRPTDIYTPSPNTPTPSTSTPPSIPIDILAQTTTPSKFVPGTTVPARPLSLPASINLIADNLQNIQAFTRLPLLSQKDLPILPNGTDILKFLNLKSFNSQTFLGTSPFIFSPNSKAGIFPSILSLAAPILPLMPFPSLTINSEQTSNKKISAGLQLTLNTIQPILPPTLLTPGTMPLPTPINNSLIFGGAAPNHFSTSLTQGFIILDSNAPHQTMISAPSLYGNEPMNLYTIPTRGSGWPSGSVFTAQFVTTPSSTATNSISSPTSLISIFDPLNNVINDLSDLNLNFQGISPVRLALPTLTSPQNFGTSIFLFLAAMRSGDLNGFLGDTTINALKRSGRGDRLEKLDGLLRNLKSLMSPATSDWKSYMIPVQTDATILPIMMHVKSTPENHQNPNGSETENLQKTGGKRVIIDMTLDRMGEVQVDMRMPHQIKQLDTILRTEFPLSRIMQNTIARLYAGAMEKTHLRGDILFQGDPKKWVTISPEQSPDIKITV